MNVRKTAFSPAVWILVLTLLLIGQQTQTQKPLTRAEDGPGFGILTQARQLNAEKKFSEAFAKALEASQVFRQNAEWELWGACYEEAFRAALKSKSNALYQQLLVALGDAAKILPATPAIPAKTQALIWRRMGSVEHFLGAYSDARLHYEKALPFAEEAADTAILLRIYGNTGIAIWHEGDDYRALNYLEKAISLAKTMRDTPVMASFMIHLGDVWRTLDTPKSIPIYLDVLSLQPDNPEALMLLSKAYMAEKNTLGEALETAKRSLQLAKSGVEKSDALHQLGRVFFEMKQYNLALSYYNQAYETAKNSYGKNHPECVKINFFKGKALLAKQDFKQALTAYNQTLDDLLPLFSPKQADQNPLESDLTSSSLWILEALVGKANVYQQLFSKQHKPEDLVRSLECAELAIYYQNKIKLHYGDDESKFALSSYFNASCDAALHSAFQLYRRSGDAAYAQRAFNISEQTKAVVLAEALYKKELKQVANVPSNLLEQERQSQEQIAYFEKRLIESEEPGLFSRLKDSLFQARRTLEIQDQQIQTNYPAYAAALFSYRTDTPVDSVQRNLPDDVALLEYFLGDSTVYTFLVTKDTFWAQEQPLPASFNQTASAFLRTVNDWRFVADSAALASKVFLDNSRLLYQWLLEKPLAVTNARRLFIVPDGKLSLLPFELLLTKSYSGQWIDRDVPFLLKERAVSYRFSCRKQAQKQGTPEKGWGGFGLEYDDTGIAADNPGLRDFGPLPFADDEIKAIKSVMGGAFWINGNATRKNFLKNAEDYGILHLAMHGVVDERNPLRSRLLFSTSVAGDDPYVYASDLYNLQLQAGLSVLSACQSGTGAWKKGEGVLSLARAFAFAGCPSMVMSLWNVSDQSTAALMVSFYQQLKAGVTKDEALRSAKLNYLNTASSEYSKPIYWASFVPIGEMNSLPAPYFSSGNGWFYWVLIVGLVVIMVFFWRSKL